MLLESNKSTRILKEVVSYFLDNQLTDLDIHFNIENHTFTLEINAPCNAEPATFKKLLNDLQTERQYEVDEYFNALLGGHAQKHDYTFLGKAIDHAEGKFENHKLYLKLIRHEDI